MSSLRQRRSKSPDGKSPHRRHNGNSFSEEELEEEETEHLVKRKKNANPATFTPMDISLQIVAGAALLILLGIGTIFGVWLPVFTGFYDPDANDGCLIAHWVYPDCSDALMHVGEVDPPMPFEDWLELRKKFQQALDKDATGVGKAPQMADDWQEPDTYGFTKNTIEFRYSQGKGRAVFATRFISKGTKIWDSRYRAVFPNSCTAKLFFANQTNQQICDAMFWGYANNFYGNGFQYMFDLDGHGYINHHDEPNAIHHFEGELETDWYGLSRLKKPPLIREDWERRNKPGAYGLYAKQDIQEGEEILYDYNEIFMYGFVDWFTILIERSLPVWEWLTL